MRLKERVALVTGGGNGIGRATALRLASEGAQVAVADIQLQAAQEVVKEIQATGKEAIAIDVNVAEWTAADEATQTVVATFGRLDILINNAGINRDAMASKLTENQWDTVLDVNLKGTFNMARAALVHMSAQKYGRVVNTASIGVRGNIGQANYVASKAGVIGLTRALALEYARYNITVNCVSPGPTDTQMAWGLPDNVREAFTKRVPLKRLADPTEIAALHTFLSSGDASYITGQCIFCDGGMSIGLL